jgi:succinate dehydrogenase/fumarate reductase flavoprotein subunit
MRSHTVSAEGGTAAVLKEYDNFDLHAWDTIKVRIALISKVYPMRSHTVSAEGGTAAVLKEYDNFDLHAWDTIKGSDFLADQDAVELFVKLAPKEVIQLEHWGCLWNRDEKGKIDVRAFGGMSVKRTVYAAST